MTASVTALLQPHVARRETAPPMPATGPKVRPRDVVTWTNANTGEVWGELVVEFVYAQLGVALVRGCFGRMSVRSGEFVVESRRVAIAQLHVDGRAGEIQS